MDDKGNKIEGRVATKFIWRHSAHLKEFATIIMSSFTLLDNNAQFKFSKHPKKIEVNASTQIKSCDGLTIPPHGLQFVEFSDVLSSAIPSDLLFDVVGEIVECTGIIISENQDKSIKKRMLIQLEDHSNHILSCTLWDGFAVELDAYVQSFDGRCPVIILQFAKTGNWEGKLCISNSKWGSRLILDEQHPEIKKFKSMGFTGGDMDSRTMSRVSGWSCTSQSQKFLQTEEISNLTQLATKTEDGFFVILATIVAFERPSKWFYSCCLKCKKAADTDGVKFYCLRCDEPVQFPGLRYSLQITVSDGSSTASLMMFDKEVQDNISISAVDLREKQAKAGVEDEFPGEFNVLLNKTFLFRVEVKSKYVENDDRRHSINTATSDDVLLDQFKQAVLSLQDTHSDVASSEKFALCTPNKRPFIDVDGPEDKDFQQSTNKPKIHVKVEKEGE